MTPKTGCTSRPNANCASTTEAAPAGHRQHSRVRGLLYYRSAQEPRAAEHQEPHGTIFPENRPVVLDLETLPSFSIVVATWADGRLNEARV